MYWYSILSVHSSTTVGFKLWILNFKKRRFFYRETWIKKIKDTGLTNKRILRNQTSFKEAHTAHRFPAWMVRSQTFSNSISNFFWSILKDTNKKDGLFNANFRNVSTSCKPIRLKSRFYYLFSYRFISDESSVMIDVH